MKLTKTCCFFLTILTVAAAPLRAADLNFQDTARIVIQAGGRKKPLDTFAIESLQLLSGRRTWREPATGQRYEALDLLFAIWSGQRDWHKLPVILVPDVGLRQELGLSPTERLYSFSTLVGLPRLSEIYRGVQQKRAGKADLTPLERETEAVANRLERLSELAEADAITIVPHPRDPRATWLAPRTAAGVWDGATAARITSELQAVFEAYRGRDGQRFAAASRELRATLAGLVPAQYPSAASVGREVFYNRLHPFRWAWLAYLGGFFVLLLPQARWGSDQEHMRAGRGQSDKAVANRWLLWTGLGAFLAGVLLQIYGFVLRCQIAGYAPVTNMYESVVWVSLGVAGFAFGLSVVYRARVYLLVAAPIAVAGLIMADLLPSVLNPNIGPLPPVLRDNFWLATHVLTITLGYAAFALAMALGHVILAGYLFRRQRAADQSSYHYLLYRVLQVGVLLLAVGTILGGVWANYAWGRFWGWDPKETWALIALLLYIFALHGRLTGWWGNFGLSLAAVVCFNGVLMAWYGVNFVLGKGMHSYGFGGGGVGWMGVFVGVDLAFVALCLAVRWRALRRLNAGPSAGSAALKGAELASS